MKNIIKIIIPMIMTSPTIDAITAIIIVVLEFELFF